MHAPTLPRCPRRERAIARHEPQAQAPGGSSTYPAQQAWLAPWRSAKGLPLSAGSPVGSQTGSQHRQASGHTRRQWAMVSAASWLIRPHPATCSDAANAPENRKLKGMASLAGSDASHRAAPGHDSPLPIQLRSIEPHAAAYGHAPGMPPSIRLRSDPGRPPGQGEASA